MIPIAPYQSDSRKEEKEKETRQENGQERRQERRTKQSQDLCLETIPPCAMLFALIIRKGPHISCSFLAERRRSRSQGAVFQTVADRKFARITLC